MKIGIDLDGVVIDSETTFRTYEEIFDINILKGNNLIDRQEPKFQYRYNWNIDNKLEICKKENVDIMIDDDWRIIKNLSENGINTLYLRDTNLKKLDENEYLKEVNNWGDIYRYIKGFNKI